ncbi:MAG: AAA family ATPase [Mucilaginibacter sp.]|jgi:predicted ATP-dependent endonuclease of OLD family|uniref:ATP-dependent nuclease n=1 Tax=Mucilaginibacter sp. TaxID=1882438 RepID=UPI00356414CB
MRYSKFEIKSFKGIKHIVLDLDKEPKSKVFTLIGLNESGKTSILEAIDFFQTDLPVKDRHKLISKSEKIDFNGSVSVSATFVLNESDNEKIQKFSKKLFFKSFEILNSIKVTKSYYYKNSNFTKKNNEWFITLKGIKINASKLKLIPFSHDSTSDWQKIVAFIKKELFPSILYYPNFLFDFPDKIYLSDNITDNKLEQLIYKDVIQDILYSINPKLTIENHLLERLKSDTESNKEALEQTLAKMSFEVTKTVFGAWAKLFNSFGKEIVIKAGAEVIGEDTLYYLIFKLKENASQFNITERSLGFKWFFSFLLFTEFRKNRVTENGEILFLLDEPASNLHSTAQKNLLNTFKEIINKSSLIYTTHSHHLINPDWLNGAYIIKNKGIDYNETSSFNSNSTDIEATIYKQFLAKYPDQREYYQPILDTLDYQPGLLEKVDSIIITEGKNDYYTLKYISSIFFKGKFDKLHLYPGGGANSNSLVIRLYLAWGKSFVILLDGDSAGEKGKKEYTKLLGRVVESNTITLTDINKSFNGKATEDLFTDDERLFITKYFDNKATAYNKGKFNTALQNLLYEKKQVQISKETLDGFEEIFKHLLLKTTS